MFNNGLPVPYDGADINTTRQNLPNVIPQLQLSPAMQQEQQFALQLINTFRGMAEERVGRSVIHTFGYNLLAQNGFNNNEWPLWCKFLLDFTEFLLLAPRSKKYSTEEAANVALQRCYEALLGHASFEYPAIQQVIPEKYHTGLKGSYTEFQKMQRDVTAFKNGTYRQQQPGGFGHTHNTGALQSNNFGFARPQQNNGFGINNHSVTGQPQMLPPINRNSVGLSGGFSNQSQSNGFNLTSTNVEGSINPLYADIEPPKQNQPIVEFDSDDYSHHQMTQQETVIMSHNVEQMVWTNESMELKIPKDVSDIVFDPYHYIPTGKTIDENKSFDEFYAPGGVIIRPAFKSSWQLTRGNDNAVLSTYDPSKYIAFHVKFPDGVVKETFVEWEKHMKLDYLRHELNSELRNRARRHNGVVVQVDMPTMKILDAPIKETDLVDEALEDFIRDTPENPILLKSTYLGTTAEEVHQEALTDLEALLQTKFSSSANTPAFEYVSAKTYSMQLTNEEFDLLTKLSDTKDLARVAEVISDMGKDGMEPSSYRLLDTRLTNELNRFLKECIGTKITVDSFIRNVAELLEYLDKKYPKQGEALRNGNTEILKKAIKMYDDGDGRGILETLVTFQVGWALEHLTGLEIHSGEPVLLSGSSHPALLTLTRNMLTRNSDNRREYRFIIRTVDGHRLEIVHGAMVTTSKLLKLL